jgi:hypothetical protein
MEKFDAVARVGFKGSTVYTRSAALVVALTVGVAGVVATGCSSSPAPKHHLISSTDDAYCKKCHETGRVGAPRFTHSQSSGCVACHNSNVVGDYPAKFTHLGGDEAKCALCHESGLFGAKPNDHIDQSDCYTCHQAVDYAPWPPSMTHDAASTNDGDCTSCHGQVDHGRLAGCYACHSK